MNHESDVAYSLVGLFYGSFYKRPAERKPVYFAGLQLNDGFMKHLIKSIWHIAGKRFEGYSV